jgi:hypothetical protein
MPVTVFSQVSFNFETASLHGWVQSTAGHWSADTSASISGRYSLHHVYDNAEAGTDQIGTRLMRLRPLSATTRWSFMIRYGADPSSSNNWAVFLMSDNDPAQMYPGGDVNGYAIGVNLTGYDDTLRLWKVKEGNITAVKALPVNWQTDIGTARAAKIDVERSGTGEWIISVSSGSFIRTASCTDPEIFSIHWFGLYYKYTSSRDRLIWIDEILIDGIFLDPGITPGIVKAIPSGCSSIDVYFDDDISPLSALATNFSCLPSEGTSQDVTILNQRTFRIGFKENLPNKIPCTLIGKNICDADSICAETITFDFIPAFAEPGNVIISEIMADPVPPVSLPVREYLEISNTTEYEFSLHGWRLVAGTENTIFPDSVIKPGEIVILCSLSDTALFSGYGKVIGLKPFPALTDEGRSLIIADGSGFMIHGVVYSQGWYSDKLKSGGGWSLEMIDTQYPFYQEGNWRASLAPEGGTPGQANSVAGNNPDNVFKGVVNVFPADSITVNVTFSEPVKEPDKMINRIEIAGNSIDSVIRSDYLGMEYKVIPGQPLEKNKIYSFTVQSDLTDWAGNRAGRKSFRFGLPVDASGNEIVFNELLFNPLPGDADYIEFFNNSERIIDANRLFVVSLNDETADTSELVRVSDTSRCILPGTFYTVTTAREAIINRYFSSADTNIFEVGKFPSMPGDKGHLLLLNHRAEKIDEVVYSEKMHFQLLSGFEGIALEKTRPGAVSGDIKNWHSASETSGWGTPGAVNSIYTEMPEPGDILTFSSTRITPDNDGYEDILVIDLRLTGNSNIVTILVFDENGSIVRKLVRNLYSSNELSVVWDGSADDGSVVGSGIYVILITVFDETGKILKWKKACAVIR